VSFEINQCDIIILFNMLLKNFFIPLRLCVIKAKLLIFLIVAGSFDREDSKCHRMVCRRQRNQSTD
jgi:hypothetical protein